MKRKLLSLFLSAVLIFCGTVLPGAAAAALPASAHPYADGLDEKTEYTFPGAADGFYMTFSEDCHFEEPSLIFYGKDGEVLDLDLDTALEMSYDELIGTVSDIGFKDGDRLDIYNDDSFIGSYSGDMLAGETVYVPGTSVTLQLVTDDSVTDYGYAVESVSAEAPEGIKTVTYVLDGGRAPVVECFTEGCEAEILSGSGIITGKKAYRAWSLTEGGEADYDGGETFTISENVTLYPVYTDILLGVEDVFSFDNDYEPFTVDGINLAEEGEEPDYLAYYYMEQEDYASMIRNLFRVSSIGPLFIPAAIAAGELLTYPLSVWGGSCYGMSLTVALQQCGLLDLLSYQEGAQTVAELAPSRELISCINYYQAQEFPAMMVQNAADYPGTNWYQVQLKKMYNEVASGKIVLFGFYENHSYDSAGHAILLTGAYDDLQGNHVLLAYDCNYGSMYVNGAATTYTISPDYSYITSEMYGDLVGIDWLSDFSAFESFDISGEGDVMSWYKSLFRHIREFFQNIIDFFRSLFGR